MIKNIKEVLSFIMIRSFREFSSHFLYYFISFFFALILTILIFFINYHAFGNHYLFILYLFCLIVLYYRLKRNLFLKNRLALHLLLIDELENRPKSNRPDNRGFPLSRLKMMKVGLKKQGMKCLSYPLFLSFSALIIHRDQYDVLIDGKLDLEPFRQARSNLDLYRWLELGVFLLTLIPFAFLAFWLSIRMGLPIRLFTYLLAFFFAYFLQAAIFDPLIGLLIQKKIWQKMS
jgi:MFS family permease